MIEIEPGVYIRPEHVVSVVAYGPEIYKDTEVRGPHVTLTLVNTNANVAWSFKTYNEALTFARKLGEALIEAGKLCPDTSSGD